MHPLLKPSAIALLLIASHTHAAGYQLAEQSATGLGRAFAGEAAIADNASVLSRNAAAMSRFDQTAFSGGVIYVRPEVNINGKVDSQSAAASDIANDAWIPNAYLIMPLNEQWRLGFSATSYYGLGVKMPDNYSASHFGNVSNIKTVDVGTALAYQVTPLLAVGAGLSVTYGEGEVGGSLTLPPQLGSHTLVSHVEGEGAELGWNLGLLLTPSAQTRVGLGYRHGIDLKLKGDAINLGKHETGHLVLTLPATAELALFHQLSDQLALHGSVNWSDWSQFSGLTAILDNAEVMDFKAGYMKDSWRYSLGMTYQFTPQWQLRSGLAYDQSPIPADQRSMTIPDSDRIWYSIGVGHQYSKALSIDLGITLLDGKKVEVTKSKDVVAYVSRLNANSEGDAWLAGAQLNYLF